jgi:hypothetical protein
MYKQTIYYGAPGTGKSHIIQEMLVSENSQNIFRVTIHPEFSYSDFIGQLLPTSNSDGSIKFVFKEGPFTLALKRAYSDSSINVYLVLEELSRGNVAAIFGDIFQLLDRDNHFKSIYPIRNKNIADSISQIIGDEIKLPSNFNILCTVNTNDQSVYPMDTAFKRRFSWQYISSAPASDVNGVVLNALNNPKIVIDLDNNERLETTWLSFYTSLNHFITDKTSGLGRNEDKQLGQFFLQFKSDLILDSFSSDETKSNDSLKIINDIIKNKLLLFLWQDVQGSYTINGKSLFSPNIRSFDDLYSKYGTEKVFNDILINSFIQPNSELYNHN